MFLNVRDKKLVVDVKGHPAQLVWIRDVVKDIYEVSVQYVGGSLDSGFHTWFTKISPDGSCDFITCSMYESIEMLAIKAAEDEAKPGKALLEKLNVR